MRSFVAKNEREDLNDVNCTAFEVITEFARLKSCDIIITYFRLKPICSFMFFLNHSIVFSHSCNYTVMEHLVLRAGYNIHHIFKSRTSFTIL